MANEGSNEENYFNNYKIESLKNFICSITNRKSGYNK